MKYSLAVPSFEDIGSNQDIETLLSRIADWGYDAVEPLICYPTEIDVAEIKRILGFCKLKISGFRTGLIFIKEGLNLIDSDNRIRERAIQRIKDTIKLAANFPEAKILNGLIQGPLRRDINLGLAQERIVFALYECCSFAQEYNVNLCLEPVNRYELSYHNTVEQVAQIVNRVGLSNLKILIDTFHMNIEEKDICGSIKEFKDYIGSVHIADSNRLSPGSGHLDFLEIINMISEIGYEGYLTVEMGPVPDTERFSQKALRFLKGIGDKKADV